MPAALPRSRPAPGAAVVAVVAVVAVLAGCAGDGPVREGSRAAGEGPAVVEVSLGEPGAEPRQRLRLSFEEGQTQRSAVTMRTGIQTEVDGEPLPIAVPGSTVVVATTVEGVDGGTARLGFVYDEARAVPGEGINPAALESVGAALEQVRGLRGSVTIDDRGGASDAAIDTSAITNEVIRTTIDTLTSQLMSLTVPFPAEAVGVGAVWSATRRAVANGVTTDTTTTYTLTALRGRDYVLAVRQTVTAPPGRADIPGLGEGLETRILSYDVTNAGTVSGSLGAPLPGRSRLQGGGDVRMKVSDGQRTSDLTQRLTTDLSLVPA